MPRSPSSASDLQCEWASDLSLEDICQPIPLTVIWITADNDGGDGAVLWPNRQPIERHLPREGQKGGSQGPEERQPGTSGARSQQLA